MIRVKVVSYRNSTSNHNFADDRQMHVALYLIEILHQTTTAPFSMTLQFRCILSKFYIKPQLSMAPSKSTVSCILSKFYIKPQLEPNTNTPSSGCILSKFYIKPQHLSQMIGPSSCCILSKFYIKPQQSPMTIRVQRSCILSKFYIKPQQGISTFFSGQSCILSKFYIKPQRDIRRSLVTYKLYLIEILHQTTTSGLILIDKVLLTGCLPL